MKKKKRLYFILTNENLFHPKYFAGVLKCLDSKEYKVVGTTQLIEKRKSLGSYLVRQLNLWGFLGFLSIGCLSAVKKILEITKVDKTSSIKLIAQKYRINYLEVNDVNAKSHLNHLRKKTPDIIISSCGQIFKRELLNLPKVACINRHSALLPKYGGVLPVFWTMYHNEKEFGVSIHFMIEKVDQGDVIYQKATLLNYRNSLFANYTIAFHTSIQATVKALDNLGKNRATKKFVSNDKQYFSYPKPADISKFKKRHKTFSLGDLKLLPLFLKDWQRYSKYF